MKLPAQKTLDTYGLTMEEWCALAGVDPKDPTARCKICELDFESMVTDHQHVRGWKTMAPAERKQYVRGVICRGCNYFVLTRQVSALQHTNAGRYLREYDEYRRDLERRRPK